MQAKLFRTIAVIAFVILVSFSALNLEQVQAQNVSYPEMGEIDYSKHSTDTYLPWTRKEAINPLWIDFANQHNGSYESIGKSSGSNNWDIVAFMFGNPDKPAVMVNAHLHGNEHYGYEIMYGLAQWLVSGDASANRILENNYVIFVPVVNYRWDRTNYNGVDLNRNFAPSWTSNISQTAGKNGGAAADSEPEAQALITAWNRYHPRIYWSLQQGSTRVYTDGMATTSQQVADLKHLRSILPSIASSLGVNGSLISNLYINTEYGSCYSGFGKGYVIDGASSHGAAGLMSQVSSGWTYTAQERADLNSGQTFKQAKAIFIAMAQAVKAEPSPPSTATPVPPEGLYAFSPMRASSFDLLWNSSILFAVVASVLLMASELSSTYYGKINKRLNKALLQKTAFVVTVLFVATMVVRVATILMT